nr:MAG TPA: minor tail protein [Caudoviricetes sp.]
MSYDGSLKFDTKIDSNGFSTGLSKLKKLAKTGVGTVGTVTSKATDMIGKFTSVVTTSVATVSAGIGTIGAAATRVGMDFEAAMSKVSSISGATGNDLQSLTDKAKEMGATTKFSATESAEAFQYMAMAGWDTKSMLDGIDGIMNLSAADGLDLATTSDIVTDALTAFGLSAKDSTHFADVLATASSSANTNVSMLGESFKYVAPLAGSMNYSIEDVSLALGLMANASVKGSMAGTSLKTALSNLASPTKSMASEMSKLGISMTDSNGNALGLRDIIIQLREKFGKLSETEKAATASTLFGKEAMSGMLAIINASDADFNKLTNNISNADGAAKQMADTLNDNLKGDITIAKSALEGFGITIYETLDTDLRSAVQLGTKYIDELSKAFTDGGLQGAVKTAGDIFGEIATKAAENAPKMIDSALQFIDSFPNGIRDNSSRLLNAGRSIVQAIIEGIINFAGYGSELIDGAVAIIENLILAISANESELLKAGESIIDSIVNGIVNLANNAGTVVRGVVALIKSFIKSVKNNKDKLLTAAKEIVKAITDGLVSLLPKEVQTPVRKCIDAITKLFNSNGLKTAIVKVGRFIGELAEQIANLASNVIPLCTEVIGFLIDNFYTITPLVITAVTAIKAYREATLLANMAQGMLNGTMSANPIGIIVGTVAALVTGIMTLTSWFNKTSDAEADLKKSQEELEKSQENYEETTDNLADSLKNAYDQMGKFQESIDNAKSSLDGVDENLIIPEETKEKLEKDMQACQDKIDAVVKLASDERRELTQNEVDELDKLIEKQKSIAEQQLKLELNRADTAQTLAQAFVTDYGLSGNADDFLEQSQQYIKGAEEAEAKVTEAAEKTCSEQIAYAKTLVGTSKKYNEDWYNNQVKTAFKTKKETIEAAKKTTSQTVGIIEKHYQQLNFSGTQYLNDNKTIKDNIAKADENYKKKLKSNGEWYNAEYAKINANQWDSSKKYAELKAKYEKKQEDATKEYTDTLAGYQTKLTEVWNEETGKEIDSILTLAKKTTEGGEKCSDSTARSVYETREALKNLPYDVREKLGDTYDKWIEAFDSLPTEMYEQGKAAAEALKKPTGRELSNDMSKNGEESITSLENGILSKIPGLSPVANIVANAIKNPTGRSLSNDMYTNGKNTVIGLINGVLSQLPGLSNVANIVASVFGGTYQGYNKINSPSKLMRSFGQYTVEGLELGLKDRAEKLAGIAKDLAESVSGTMSNGLNNDIMLDTNAEMTARLKTAVFAQAGEIGLNVATKNADNYDTQSDSNSSVKASGNITTHINIDGREFAVATVPYIDEELAFIKG